MQYIGFNLNSNEYTIPILKVREIINLPSITRMPQSPPYIEGITNIRGNIIPIVNLKKLVNLNNPPNPPLIPPLLKRDKEGSKGSEGGFESNKVIVIAAGKITFGIFVDGITGVINIEESSIEPPESFLNGHVEQVKGVAKLPDRLVVLLDTKKLLPLDDMSLFEDFVVDIQERGDKVEVEKTVQTMAGEMKVTELYDTKTFFEQRGIDSNDPRYLIFDDIVNFIDALSVQDYEKADDAIQHIIKKGQGDLFKEVGKITRKLHDSIKSFKEAIDPKLKNMAMMEMPNAIDRLQFVMDQTEEAANKTLGIVEKYILSMDEISSHIRNIKEPADSVNYLKNFKNSLEDDLTEILTTQSFQDITGQTIKRVIKLVGDIEEELVRLVTTFGVKIEHGKTEVLIHEKVSQADVDDLLKDFGF
ncbi:MAG: protein phosphatase CheZ [Nitrospirota bacterium]